MTLLHLIGPFSQTIPNITELFLEKGNILTTFIEKLPQSITSLKLVKVQTRKTSKIDLSKLKLTNLECNGVDWDKLVLPKSLITLKIDGAKVHSMIEVEKLYRLKALSFSNCQFTCTKVLNIRYPETLKEMSFKNLLPCVVDDLEPNAQWPDFIQYMILQVPHVIKLDLPSGLESFSLSKREDCNMLFMSEDTTYHDGLKNLELSVSGVYNSAHPDMPQENSLSLNAVYPETLERLVVRGENLVEGFKGEISVVMA